MKRSGERLANYLRRQVPQDMVLESNVESKEQVEGSTHLEAAPR